MNYRYGELFIGVVVEQGNSIEVKGEEGLLRGQVLRLTPGESYLLDPKTLCMTASQLKSWSTIHN